MQLLVTLSVLKIGPSFQTFRLNANKKMAQVKKRRKIHISNPNPDFESALQSLIELNSNDSLIVKKYEQCLSSLKKYPLKLNNLNHCKILAGFDKSVIDAMKIHLNTPKSTLSPIRSKHPEIWTEKSSPSSNFDSPKRESVEQDPDMECPQTSSIQKVSEDAQKANSEEDECDPDLVLARQLSQEWNNDAEIDFNRQKQEEEDRLLALKLNQENYLNRSWSAPNPVSSQFDVDFDLELTSKRVSGVVGTFRMPLINPNEVEITPPPPTSVKNAVKMQNARAKLFSQDPILRHGNENEFDLSDGNDSLMAKIGQMTSISKPQKDSGEERKLHSISDSDEEGEPVISPPKPSISKKSRKNVKVAKEAPKRKCSSKKKAGVEFIQEHEIPQWVTDLRCSQLEEEEVVGDQLQSEFTLLPGEYEIVLIVDFAEVVTGGGGTKARGGSASNKKPNALKELTANGVTHETRKLHVGDFIWIAKEKVAVNPSRLRQREPKELVLPYIVERKRLDDLKNSIIDGRYKEQKMRLRECGLPYRWYLVEEFNKKMKYWANGPNGQKFNLQALEQAVASTSAIEGFNIKRTEDLKESVAFLTLTTRFLQNKYSNAILRSCTHQDLHLHLVQDVDHVLLSFKEFNDNSRKNKPLTIKDGFTRILCCQHGVTWPMATAIAHKYSTLANLMQIYDNCQNSEERENLLTGITYDGGKRMISAQISKIISWLFSDEELK